MYQAFWWLLCRYCVAKQRCSDMYRYSDNRYLVHIYTLRAFARKPSGIQHIIYAPVLRSMLAISKVFCVTVTCWHFWPGVTSHAVGFFPSYSYGINEIHSHTSGENDTPISYDPNWYVAGRRKIVRINLFYCCPLIKPHIPWHTDEIVILISPNLRMDHNK